MRNLIFTMLIAGACAFGIGCGDDGNGGGGGGAKPGCAGLCNYVVDCFNQAFDGGFPGDAGVAFSYDDCVQSCNIAVDHESGACGAAIEAYGNCLSSASCSDSSACDSESSALDSACQNPPGF